MAYKYYKWPCFTSSWPVNRWYKAWPLSKSLRRQQHRAMTGSIYGHPTVARTSFAAGNGDIKHTKKKQLDWWLDLETLFSFCFKYVFTKWGEWGYTLYIYIYIYTYTLYTYIYTYIYMVIECLTGWVTPFQVIDLDDHQFQSSDEVDAIQLCIHIINTPHDWNPL